MCNYNTELLDFVCSGLFVRCRAGAPGCGRTRTSSGPRTAPPRGCPGWSAAGPASLASHARAPAARRSTLSLKHQTGQWKSLRSLLACWRISAKVFPWHRNVQKIAAAAASWFQPDLSNKGTFRPYLFRGCNRRSPPRAPLRSGLSYRKPAVCLSGSRWGGWVGLPPSLSHPRRQWGRSAAGGMTARLYWALQAEGPWASPCEAWVKDRKHYWVVAL